MTKTRLFIENVEVELNNEVQFLLNQQFTDISNPATIFNDWSKTIDIPFTSHNNELFGHLYNEDRLIAFSNNPDESLIGIYFNPNKKLNFRLEWDGVLLMSGYVKTNSIKKTLTGGSYNITLNGELGRVFQELDKITMDLTKLDTVDYKYVLDTRQYANFPLNKEAIYKSWNNEGQKHVSIDDTDIEWTDIVGFAPSNAFDENFDAKSILSLDESLLPIIQNISETLPQTIQNIQTDSIIKDGLSPLTMKQFRSYNQLPFVWVNKLFDMFAKKAEDLTEYKFVLDESWFNTTNPYWYDCVLMLNNLKENTKSEECARCEMRTMPVTPGSTDTGLFNLPMTIPSDSYYIGDRGFLLQYGQVYFVPELYSDWSLKNCRFNLNLGKIGTPLTDGTTIYKRAIYYADVNILDELDEPIKTVTYAFISENHDFYFIPQAEHIVTVSGSVNNNITLPFNILLNDIPSGIYHLSINFRWRTNGAKLSDETSPDMSISVVTQITFYDYNNYAMSNSIFNINRYWNNEVSPWKIILNYLKTNHIFIEVDDASKKIKLTPYYKYFTDVQISNWTNKLDISKDFIIKPSRPDEKYLMFDYDDTELGLFSKYQQKYGISYGGIRIDTNNNFNTNSKRFIESLKPIGVYSPMFIEYFRGLLNNNVTYVTPSIYLPVNTDDDNKSVSLFGSMFFAKGYDTFRDVYNQTDIYYITDDDVTEVYNDTYVYHASLTTDNSLRTTRYTRLHTYIEDKNLWFNTPKEIYYNEGGEWITSTKSIYEMFWKNYIAELYNPQNKQITAYLRLSPMDYISLKSNKFIVIKNQLYFVNKIFDYDITSSQSTKCELITVQNINNYNNTTFMYWGISPYLRELRTNQWSGTVFNDYKITGWNHENKTFTLVDVQLDGESVGNNWTKTITVTDTDTPSLYDLTFNITPPVPLIIQAGEQRVLTFTIEDSDGEQKNATIIIKNPNITSESSEMVDD